MLVFIQAHVRVGEVWNVDVVLGLQLLTSTESTQGR